MDLINLETEKLRDLTIVATKDQVSSDLDGEAVILNLKTGIYLGLDTVGTRIWKLLQESKTVKDILDTLILEYEVELERCERDLLALLQRLADEGLIEVRNEAAA